MLSYPHLDQLGPELLVQRAQSLTEELTRLRSTATLLTNADLDWMWSLKIESMYALFRADMLLAHRTVKPVLPASTSIEHDDD